MTAALSERKPATEEISGLIERVTFHNQESGLCPMPCALCLKTQGPPGGDHGHRVAALGNRWGMAGCRGLVGRNKEHGPQFKANTMKTVPPTTVSLSVECVDFGIFIPHLPLMCRPLFPLNSRLRTCRTLRLPSGSARVVGLQPSQYGPVGRNGEPALSAGGGDLAME